ncbi:MAG TPA: hypothetical protein VGS57_10930 [Thermoanaerobaculia bacterium]|jgi:hypothetical protein|nr:hypothetical protein [Thermoanaerobaculia bacterium]
MNARTYCTLSAVVFAVVALAHLVRAVQGTAVVIGSWQTPVAISWLAVVVAGGLAVWGFRLAGRGPAA